VDAISRDLDVDKMPMSNWVNISCCNYTISEIKMNIQAITKEN